jgi:hypothetical protein
MDAKYFNENFLKKVWKFLCYRYEWLRSFFRLSKYATRCPKKETTTIANTKVPNSKGKI